MRRFYLITFSILLTIVSFPYLSPDLFYSNFYPERMVIFTAPLEKGFGVVLLSGPNLEDAKKMGKIFCYGSGQWRGGRRDSARRNDKSSPSGLGGGSLMGEGFWVRGSQWRGGLRALPGGMISQALRAWEAAV